MVSAPQPYPTPPSPIIRSGPCREGISNSRLPIMCGCLGRFTWLAAQSKAQCFTSSFDINLLSFLNRSQLWGYSGYDSLNRFVWVPFWKKRKKQVLEDCGFSTLISHKVGVYDGWNPPQKVQFVVLCGSFFGGKTPHESKLTWKKNKAGSLEDVIQLAFLRGSNNTNLW